ncbi:DNA primase [Stratiformator vulcanicus]|uniref:DNA primase n=1 Tax=Stratiformator vulcanicus TaxID=2527980 RepID=A0A517R120_9PLAN|nr:DNA primase [Stratiformator vulcanicus]QDT37571.1 DNA primase [Stratiformator vulcanicus]
MSSSDEFKELVRSRTSIVEVVGDSVTLSPRRGGAEYVGLCPFHDDHNPSMHVYPDRQSFRCWVCDEGGDVFSFVMKHDGLDFRQTLEQLAERAGLEMPKRSAGYSNNSSGTGSSDKNRLFAAAAWAEREMHQCFLTGAEGRIARDYCAGRGITSEMIDRFKIGYHPNDWSWLLDRAKGNFTHEELFAARLVREKSQGNGYRDDFVGRLMFPIRDERGRAVAFGGRVLPGQDYGPAGDAKYLNSPEGVLFKKSQLLYALDAARDAIRASRPKTALVMEGYTDCIAAHQAGYQNAVAPLGTSLTEQHVSVLKRFAERVVLVFDGDDAGLSAAHRALEKFLAQDVDLRILTLPEGLDPADFLAKDDVDKSFKSLIEQAPDALQFRLNEARRTHGLDTALGRTRIADDVLSTLAAAGNPDPGRVNGILSKLSDLLMIGDGELRTQLSRLRGNQPTPRGGSGRPHFEAKSYSRHERVERDLLGAVMMFPEHFGYVAGEIGSDDFQSEPMARLFDYCRDVSEIHGPPAYDLLISKAQPDLVSLIVSIDSEIRTKTLSGPTERSTPGSNNPRPEFLSRAVELIKRRRQDQTFERSRGQIAQKRAEDGDVLDDQMKQLLRRAHETISVRHVRN